MKILIIDTFPMKASSWFSQLIEDLGSKKDVELDYVNIDNNFPENWKKHLLKLKKKKL